MVLITKSGMIGLQNDYKSLKQEEQEALEAVVVARDYGDLSENAELDAAKEWLERVRSKISEIEGKLSVATIADASSIDKDKVNFGAGVFVKDLRSGNSVVYKIVSDIEANINYNKISISSLTSQALIGKSVGDEVVFATPNGERYLLIESIDYSWLD